MSETTFREKVEPAVEPDIKVAAPVSISVTNIEVPYLDYENEHGKPYTVEHFNLGERWGDRDGGYRDQVTIIESYLQQQATDREIDNSLKGVKNRLKEIEKITGMDKEDRMAIKVDVIAEYLKFLSKRRDIEKNIRRYS